MIAGSSNDESNSVDFVAYDDEESSVAAFDSTEAPYKSDSAEYVPCEDDGKASESIKTESFVASPPVSPVSTANLSSDVAAYESFEVPYYESDLAEFDGFDDDGKDQSDQNSVIAGYTYDDDSDSATSEETEVGSNRSSYKSNIVVKERAVELEVGEEEVEAQEMAYDDDEDHRSNKERREQRRLERYEAAERRRIAKVMYFAVFVLLLELVAASIAVKNHQDLVECCGNSIFSENESVGERLNSKSRFSKTFDVMSGF